MQTRAFLGLLLIFSTGCMRQDLTLLDWTAAHRTSRRSKIPITAQLKDGSTVEMVAEFPAGSVIVSPHAVALERKLRGVR